MGRILAIGAHPDDIEIHCGGYLLEQKESDKIFFVASSNEERRDEARISSIEFNKCNLIFGYEKDGQIKERQGLVEQIEDLIIKNKPDMVLTHWIGDYHQDHRAVAYATQAACRGKKIWLWQYPDNSFMFLNDSFNVTVDIEDVIEEKRKLLDIFQTQKDKFYIKEAKKLTKEFFKVSANL